VAACKASPPREKQPKSKQPYTAGRDDRAERTARKWRSKKPEALLNATQAMMDLAADKLDEAGLAKWLKANVR
jgi:hypothetical protein